MEYYVFIITLAILVKFNEYRDWCDLEESLLAKLATEEGV